MEDFIRLNLNGVIGMLFTLVVLTIVYFLVSRFAKNMVSEEEAKVWKKWCRISYWGLISIWFICGIFMLLSQTSVNQLPKAKIDRSYTNDATQSYQDRVKKESKKIEEEKQTGEKK